MAKLILDTSSWLDLVKHKHYEVLEELEFQVATGRKVLLISDIVKAEWHRHKEKVIGEIAASIRGNAKSAMNMASLLVPPFV